ncbi:MAG TPA: STAS domain-containing protein [Candidatus Binataceae bacterium]
MELQERIDGDALVATVLESRLDASSAPALKKRMAALIKDGHHRLALDLSAVEFIDSSGLSAMVSALRQLQGDGDLVLIAPRNTVLSMFKLTRLDRVFRIFPDQTQALAALASPISQCAPDR